MQIYRCVHKIVGMDVCISVCMSVRTCVCVCICMCTWVYVSMHSHTDDSGFIHSFPISYSDYGISVRAGKTFNPGSAFTGPSHTSQSHSPLPCRIYQKVFAKKNVQRKQEEQSQLNVRLKAEGTGDQGLAGSSCSLPPHRRAPAAPKALPGL